MQQRIDALHAHYDNSDITCNELLEGLSLVVAKNIKPKKRNKKRLFSVHDIRSERLLLFRFFVYSINIITSS